MGIIVGMFAQIQDAIDVKVVINRIALNVMETNQYYIMGIA